jgi:hypothetical protein
MAAALFKRYHRHAQDVATLGGTVYTVNKKTLSSVHLDLPSNAQTARNSRTASLNHFFRDFLETRVRLQGKKESTMNMMLCNLSWKLTRRPCWMLGKPKIFLAF